MDIGSITLEPWAHCFLASIPFGSSQHPSQVEGAVLTNSLLDSCLQRNEPTSLSFEIPS